MALDPESVSVTDALDALRTFPRRYRETVAGALAGGATADGAVTGVLTRVVNRLSEAADELARGAATQPPPRPARPESSGPALDALESVCTTMVEIGDRLPWDAWSRIDAAGRPLRRPVQEAAATGSDGLREIGRLGGVD